MFTPHGPVRRAARPAPGWNGVPPADAMAAEPPADASYRSDNTGPLPWVATSRSGTINGFHRLQYGKAPKISPLWIVSLATCLLLGGLGTPVAAQEYRQLQPKITKRATRISLEMTTKDVLRGKVDFQEGKRSIDAYYVKYFFPTMTRYAPSDLENLADYREDLLEALRDSTVPTAQKYLTGLALKACWSLARGDYHPAVRYNAALILGLLDQRYAQVANSPVPLAKATDALLQIIERDTFQMRDKKVPVPTSTKVAAWLGLERHARFGMDSKYAPRVASAALATIEDQQPDTEVEPAVQHWMQCLVAGVLAYQFSDGPPPQIQAALMGLISADRLSLDDRCRVAKLVSRIEYATAEVPDGQAAVLALGALTQDVMHDENQASQEFESSRRNDSDAPYPRHRLLSRLSSIYTCGTTLVDGLAEKPQQNIEALLSALDPVINVLENKKSSDTDVTNSVIRQKPAVDQVVAPWKLAGENSVAAPEAGG